MYVFTDVTVTAEGLGNVTVDITYGGAFYAVVPAGKVGLQLSSSAQEFRNVANKLKGDTCNIFLLLNTFKYKRFGRRQERTVGQLFFLKAL